MVKFSRNTCLDRHLYAFNIFSSVQFSHSVVCKSLWPHGLQHTRLPCPSPTPGACSNSCPSSQWCHPIISSCVIPFSSRLQSFPASGSCPMSQFFASRWPKYWCFSFSISSSNEYSGLTYFRMDWLDLLVVQGTLKSLLQRPSATNINKQTKRLPSNAGHVGLIPAPGTKISHMPHGQNTKTVL